MHATDSPGRTRTTRVVALAVLAVTGLLAAVGAAALLVLSGTEGAGRDGTSQLVDLVAELGRSRVVTIAVAVAVGGGLAALASLAELARTLRHRGDGADRRPVEGQPNSA